MNRKEYDALLSKYEGEISDAFLKAIEQIKSQVVLQEVIDALEAGNVDSAVKALRLEPTAFYIYEKSIEGTLFGAGSIIIATIKSPAGRLLQTYFDMKNPRAEAWLAEKAAHLIKEVVEPTQTMVRAAMVQGLKDGRNPRSIALDIVGRIDRLSKKREGGILGLTSGQAEFVTNAKIELQNLDKNYFNRSLRDKRFDSVVKTAIKNNEPLKQEYVDKLVNRYTQRLLKYRGNMIGRTEAMSALNYSEYESFKQGLEGTNYSESQIVSTWESAHDLRVRDTHSVLNGKHVRGLETPFRSPRGALMRFPTDRSLGAPASEIINCRCRVVRKIDYFNEFSNV